MSNTSVIVRHEIQSTALTEKEQQLDIQVFAKELDFKQSRLNPCGMESHRFVKYKNSQCLY